VIAFVGSVFSPAYFRARRREIVTVPDEHCALNVALYGPAARWSLTEQPAARVARSEHSFTIGDSALHWENDALVVDLVERTPVLGRALRGRLRVHPHAIAQSPELLDPDGRHHWWCLAPMATVEVELEAPRLRWRGEAYLDTNFGREPLELGMERWDWCRARGPDDAIVLYDTWPRRGAPVERAWRFGRNGSREPIDGLERRPLPPTRWRLPRSLRCDPGGDPQVRGVLEDTPFYARSLLTAPLHGTERVVVHESVSLDRFRRPLVQRMLPFRIRPRWRA
jgi:carotenoid 1,2-hydratase